MVELRHEPVPVAWNVSPDSITLLRDCANPLLAPPISAGISFRATGATLRLNRARRRLMVMPTGPAVVLRAYRGARRLFAHTFLVSTPPLPSILCYYGGPEATYEHYRKENSIAASVTLRARADENFHTVLPEDARYRVAEFQATLLRQGETLRTVSIKGSQADLSAWYDGSQLGDSLRLNVLRVERQNFNGITEPVFMRKLFTIPFRWEDSIGFKVGGR